MSTIGQFLKKLGYFFAPPSDHTGCGGGLMVFFGDPRSNHAEVSNRDSFLFVKYCCKKQCDQMAG